MLESSASRLLTTVTSLIGHLFVIAIIFTIGYASGWKKAFEYSDHLDGLDDTRIER